MARDLGRRGWRLLLTGRNTKAGELLTTELRRVCPDPRAEFFAADVAEPSAVRQLAGWVKQQSSELDVLINSAGARFNQFGQNEAGVERTFAVNHLGHFLLTSLLQDWFGAGAGARVVTLGSGTHHHANPSLGWNLGPANYDGKAAYANAKLACILFARELARRLAGQSILAVAVDPGAVATNFARNNGWLAWCKHLLYHRLKGNLVSPREGAAGVVHVATTPSASLQSGGYYHDDHLVESSPAAADPGLARELWMTSEDLAGVRWPEA